MKLLRAVATFSLAAWFVFAPLPSYARRPPEYIAGAVSVMCAATGLVLYEANQHRLHYPASIVKVMTALIVLENTTDLNEIVTLSERAVALPWYAANMGLLEGDAMTLWEALHGIMLPSANEVANALAEHVAGSVEDFIEKMNRRAHELGAVNTYFVNACGLPGEGQHTTAYDVSLIMRQAVTHPVFLQVISTAFFDFPPSQRHPQGRTLRNTNRLVRYGDDLHTEWVVGGKTGWIRAARNTLTTYSVQDGRGLIVTVLYTEYREATFADTITLLSHGFALLAEVPLPAAAQPREESTGNSTQNSSGVIFLPVTEGVPAPNPENTADPPVPSSPWEALRFFTLTLLKIFAGAAALAGTGILVLLWKK
ncbi:MAG: D-alanyl-D-alanine carboxypeptidase [Defluviitaleaceae bacterium]|nr:D-alanyl-D-alanine carboxypeptidase [Defluviitaleaceae bacterium]MCL2240163.1 D-alanyl-D-alanine carboxypeptidase [Defluviitaleaceae bacterium]